MLLLGLTVLWPSSLLISNEGLEDFHGGILIDLMLLLLSLGSGGLDSISNIAQSYENPE